MKLFIKLSILVFLIAPVSLSYADTINIRVKGLVCDFCARGIERTFKRTGKVEDLTIDLDAGHVKVVTKPGMSMTDKEVETAITDSGYHMIEIERE